MEPQPIQDLIFVGTKSQVLAIHKKTGREAWRCTLEGGMISGSSFVTLMVDGHCLYAHTGGQLFCINAIFGRILWRNELPGAGFDLASLAMEGTSVSPTGAQQKVEAASS